MKSRIFGFLLGMAAKKLDGKKTVIGGIGFLLYAIIGAIGNMFPDQGLPVLTIDQIFFYGAAGFSVLGLGGKAEKLKTAVAAKKEGE